MRYIKEYSEIERQALVGIVLTLMIANLLAFIIFVKVLLDA